MKSTEQPEFGKRLAALRKEHQLTQAELAERLGISIDLYKHYERRSANPNLQFIRRAAEALDVPVAALVTDQPRGGLRPGPRSKLEQQIRQLENLPVSKQKLISKMLQAALEA